MLLRSTLLLMALHHATTEELAPRLFNLEHYNNTCKRSFGAESFDSESCGDLVDFCPLFHDVMLEAMDFACTGNASAIHKISNLNLLYKRKFDAVRNKTLALVTSLLDLQHVIHVVVASRQLTERFIALDTLSLTSIELRTAARTGFNPKNALSKYLAVERKILESAKVHLRDAYALKRNVEMNRMSAVFSGHFYLENLHLNTMAYVIDKCKQKVLAIEEALPVVEATEVLRTTVFPTILWAELLVGVAGNGLMTTILVKHSVIRYIMLTSLLVVNTFSLLITLPFVVATVNQPWKWNQPLCRMIWFFRKLSEFVCTYSLVVLSYQRFQQVYPYTERQRLSDKTFVVIMAVFIWLFGILFSLPETAYSDVEWGRCLSSEFSMPYIAYFRMMVLCLTPVCPLILFPVLVSIRLRQSTVPCGKSKEQPVVETSALVAMVIVLLLTCIPSTIFHLVRKQTDSFKEMIQLAIAINLVDAFSFLNCALNPLVFLILSKEFKSYFIGMFTCCRLYRVNQKQISNPV